jgi:hypothetical protein
MCLPRLDLKARGKRNGESSEKVTNFGSYAGIVARRFLREVFQVSQALILNPY